MEKPLRYMEDTRKPYLPKPFTPDELRNIGRDTFCVIILSEITV